MKKLLSIILIVCILATACSITALASDTTNKNSFVICPEGLLQKVYFYVTDSEGNQLNGDFPGTEIFPALVDCYGNYEYLIEYPENTAYVIVGNGGRNQTEVIDLNKIYNGRVYCGSGVKNDQGHFLVEYMRYFAPDASTEIGDINADKTVDVFDAVVIQRLSVEDPELKEVQKKVADFNFDGIVDVLDAAAIQKAVAG